MDAIVKLTEPVTEADSYALDQLAEDLRQNRLFPIAEKAPPMAGRKDGGLTLAISLIGLGLSAVGTIVSVLSFWLSTHPGYKIKVQRAGVEIAIENPTPKQISAATAALMSAGEEVASTISISKEQNDG
jgi:hypothetical protein